MALQEIIRNERLDERRDAFLTALNRLISQGIPRERAMQLLRIDENGDGIERGGDL